MFGSVSQFTRVLTLDYLIIVCAVLQLCQSDSWKLDIELDICMSRYTHASLSWDIIAFYTRVNP